MTKTIFVLVLVLLNAFKFFNLGGGIVLGEPDEVTHAEIVANFSKGFWPEFSGGPWYYSLPLYPRLAYLISSFFSGQFLALRAVSCLFSLVLALAIFFYVRWKCSHRVILSEERSNESKDLSARLRTRSKTERLHSQEILRSPECSGSLRMTRGDVAGFAAALLWTLCPFAVYYSRVGVIEMTVTAFCFLFLFSFDYALETRQKKWALLSGFFLALALLMKYTALIFVVVAGIYFVILSISQTLKGVESATRLRQGFGGQTERARKKASPLVILNLFQNLGARMLKLVQHDVNVIKLDIIPTIPLFITAAVFLPIAFVFYRHDPYLFKVHTMVNLISWERFTGARVWVGENHLPSLVWPFIERMGWWLSWPILVLAVIGIISSLAKGHLGGGVRSRIVGFFRSGIGDRILISFLVACFFILRRLPFYPRYFLPLVPFFVIFAGIGFEVVVRLITRHPELGSGSLPFGPPRFRIKSGMTIGVLLLIPTIFILPTSIEAFRATQHSLIESTGQYIKSRSQTENPWIFSNYWPHFFGQAANTSKATWLAESKDELQAFIPDEERTASEILEEEGGFVVLEELYSKALISSNKYRQEAHQWLLENYEPIKVIPDPSPNFPHSKLNENRVEVFVVE